MSDRCPLYPPKVDIGQRGRDVRFVPKADSCTAAKGIVIESPCRRELLTVVIADDETGVLFFTIAARFDHCAMPFLRCATRTDTDV